MNIRLYLSGKVYAVDPTIQNYQITSKPSSNVDFFGHDIMSGRFFIQFKPNKSGAVGSYIFSDVPPSVTAEAMKAESIGKYFAANIRGKYEATKFEVALVKEATNEPL